VSHTLGKVAACCSDIHHVDALSTQQVRAVFERMFGVCRHNVGSNMVALVVGVVIETYGLATISGLPENIGFFCTRALQKKLIF